MRQIELRKFGLCCQFATSVIFVTTGYPVGTNASLHLHTDIGSALSVATVTPLYREPLAKAIGAVVKVCRLISAI